MGHERTWGAALLLLALSASRPALADPAEIYATVCAACHGPAGAGDGPAAAAMPVKPGNFTDPAFWAARDDARIAKVIKEGAAAVGGSPLMVAFGALVPDAELMAMVRYLRAFESKPPTPSPAPSTGGGASGATPGHRPDPAGPAPSELQPPPTPQSGSTGGLESGPTQASAAAPQTASVALVRHEIPRPAADLANGAHLYRSRCAQCHGARGDGRGPAARFMQPRPRDFTSGIYKFTSTAMGEPATAADVYRAITHGMRGTSMPGWRGLSSDDRWQLAYYVRSLSPRLDGPEPEEVLVPAAPPSTSQAIAHGAELFRSVGCAACHGPDGRGDGVASDAMVDEKGRKITPADLTRGWRLRGGNAPEDVFRTISNGIGGTPMPGFEGLSEEERWALVHFVRNQFADADVTLR